MVLKKCVTFLGTPKQSNLILEVLSHVWSNLNMIKKNAF